jgi:nicotinamidase-related amidase
MVTKIDAKTALVVIDLQQGIAFGNKAHPLEDVLGNAAALVQSFREAGLPIVIVNVNLLGAVWTKSRKDVENDLSKILQTQEQIDAFTSIVPQIVTTQEDIFITKQTWNAFFNTSLHEKLQEKNVTGIVFCGISTSIGVEGSARAASELGYNITFATDAMTDSSIESHNNSIKYIFPRLGEVGVSEDVITRL